MATIHAPQLARQKTSTKWGELIFDENGMCEIPDAAAGEVAAAGFRGWRVIGGALEAADDLDNEELDDEGTETEGDAPAEGEDAPKKSKKKKARK